MTTTFPKYPEVTLPELIGDDGIFIDGDWVESKDQDKDGDVRLLQLADIGVGEYLNKSNRFMTSAKAKVLKCTYVMPGDILIARMPDPVGRACIFTGDEKPCVTVVDVCILRPDTSVVDPNWLVHRINSPGYQNEISSWITGSTRQRISRGNLSRLKIPLPPLPEQKRIAAILDKAYSIRRKRQEAVRLTEELLRSVYAEKMKISRAPEITISEMLEEKILLLHKDGNHGSQYPRTEEFSETGVPFLSASCFNDAGGLLESQVQFLNEKKANSLKIGWIQSGDVLLAHNATVGRVALYDGRYEKALIGTSLTAFRTDNVSLKSEFLYCALRSWSFQNQLEKNMGQTTRNQVPITAQRDLTISLPDIDLQEQIVTVQRKMNAVLGNLSAACDYSKSLFDSLLQRAFKAGL
jgi:type I restriction enzyme S subunit